MPNQKRYRKVVKAGNIVEVVEYQNGISTDGRARNPLGRKSKATPANNQENRRKSVHQAKTTLFRLIAANVGQWKDDKGKTYSTKFMTLTFADNITDLDEANARFKQFREALNYRITQRKTSFLQYIAVPEFQERGAVHFHVLLFNMPYIDQAELDDLWGWGSVYISTEQHPYSRWDYMCKGFDDLDERMAGRRKYFPSRGLKKPITIADEDIDAFLASLPDGSRVNSRGYYNEHLGVVTYTRHNLSKRTKK